MNKQIETWQETIDWFRVASTILLLAPMLAMLALALSGCGTADCDLSGNCPKKGETGNDGQTGPEGEPGVVGPKGGQGETGTAGTSGPQGGRGEQGPGGPAGSPGEEGSQGQPGPTGNPGPSGAPGEAGASGPVGSPGPIGPGGSDGAMGANGQPGANGSPGPAGPAGHDGAQGPTGPAGSPGPTGPTGAQGGNGRSAHLGRAVFLFGASGVVGSATLAGLSGLVFLPPTLSLETLTWASAVGEGWLAVDIGDTRRCYVRATKKKVWTFSYQKEQTFFTTCASKTNKEAADATDMWPAFDGTGIVLKLTVEDVRMPRPCAFGISYVFIQ